MATKKPKKSGAVLHVHKHPYVGDGVTDHRGHDRCADCGLDEGHAVHQPDPVDPSIVAAALERDAEILGEREVGS